MWPNNKNNRDCPSSNDKSKDTIDVDRGKAGNHIDKTYCKHLKRFQFLSSKLTLTIYHISIKQREFVMLPSNLEDRNCRLRPVGDHSDVATSAGVCHPATVLLT